MITQYKIRRLRYLEWFSIIALIALLFTLSWVFEQQLDVYLQYGLVAVIALLVFVLYFVQRKLDGWLTATSMQTSFAANEEFNSLYQSSPVAYITINSAGKMIDFNPAAINLLHGSSDQMVGQNFFDLVHPDYDASVMQGKIKSGLTINDESIPIHSYEEDDLWVSMSVHSQRFDDKRMLSLVDVTEKRAVDTAKSEFVALATHQLRTPIAAIRWNVELLEKKSKDTMTEDQARYFVKINRNVQRMVHLINDFLSVSKLEMGTFASSQEALNLTEFFDSILDEFSEKITEKAIVVDRQDNPPQTKIMTDGRLFHIIVSNLVSNSTKYLNPQGALTLTYELEGQKLRIVVADNGIGIPEEEVGRLFSKFFRATNAQTHQTQGTGLGLYVVKQSVEKLGGTIEVESSENNGARFMVELPVTVLSNVS